LPRRPHWPEREAQRRGKMKPLSIKPSHCQAHVGEVEPSPGEKATETDLICGQREWHREPQNYVLINISAYFGNREEKVICS